VWWLQGYLAHKKLWWLHGYLAHKKPPTQQVTAAADLVAHEAHRAGPALHPITRLPKCLRLIDFVFKAHRLEVFQAHRLYLRLIDFVYGDRGGRPGRTRGPPRRSSHTPQGLGFPTAIRRSRPRLVRARPKVCTGHVLYVCKSSAASGASNDGGRLLRLLRYSRYRS